MIKLLREIKREVGNEWIEIDWLRANPDDHDNEHWQYNAESNLLLARLDAAVMIAYYSIARRYRKAICFLCGHKVRLGPWARGGSYCCRCGIQKD